jgi:hypothetical protein
VQSSDPDFTGGANSASMNQFREKLLVEAGTEEFWRVQQHGSCLLRFFNESGDRLTAPAAVRWIADAVQAGSSFEVDAICDEPPLVMVHLRRSPS